MTQKELEVESKRLDDVLFIKIIRSRKRSDINYEILENRKNRKKLLLKTLNNEIINRENIYNDCITFTTRIIDLNVSDFNNEIYNSHFKIYNHNHKCIISDLEEMKDLLNENERDEFFEYVSDYNYKLN